MSNDQLTRLMKEIVSVRASQSLLFSSINDIHASYQTTAQDPCKLFHGLSVQQQQLLDLYRTAFVHAGDEFNLASECLDKLRTIIQRRRDTASSTSTAASSAAQSSGGAFGNKSATSSSTSNKRKAAAVSNGLFDVSTEPSKRAKGDVWSHVGSDILLAGTRCAALVDKDSSPQLWILANIQAYRAGPRAKYTVVDMDPGEYDDFGNKPPPKIYHLEPRRILPLPTLDEVPVNKRKEFPKGSRVLALWPDNNVTTLYPATVSVPPRKQRNGKYALLFDDEDQEATIREVAVEFIAPYPGRWTEDGWE